MDYSEIVIVRAEAPIDVGGSRLHVKPECLKFTCVICLREVYAFKSSTAEYLDMQKVLDAIGEHEHT